MLSRFAFVIAVASPLTIGAQQTVKTEVPDSLARMAKLSESAARKIALATVPHGTVSAVELEREDGVLQYSYDIDVQGAPDITEVHIDAMTGKLLGTEHEAKARKEP